MLETDFPSTSLSGNLLPKTSSLTFPDAFKQRNRGLPGKLFINEKPLASAGNITVERADFPMIDACPDPKRQKELSKRR
jgi:hypothetical protein